jgi:hypothetical protein
LAARRDEVQPAVERRGEVQTTGGGGGGGRSSGEAQSVAENDEPINEALIHGISMWVDAASSKVAATGTKRRRSRSSSSGSLCCRSGCGGRMEAVGWGMANVVIGRSRWTRMMMMCSILVDWIILKIFPSRFGQNRFGGK